MGAFMVFDVGFKSKKDRDKFEKKYEIRKKDILVDECANSGGFCAWTFMRNATVDVIYFMGFMGYGDPHEMLKECKKEKINITFLTWIPINDRDSIWEKLKGTWGERRPSKRMCSDCLWHEDKPKCKDEYCLVNKLSAQKRRKK